MFFKAKRIHTEQQSKLFGFHFYLIRFSRDLRLPTKSFFIKLDQSFSAICGMYMPTF